MPVRRTSIEPETYQWWREQRQGIEPYLLKLYPQIEPLLADAEAIIDLCGGEGHTHEMLSEEFSSRMTTVDLDENALERLRTRHPEATAVRADANRLPFDDESFDAAIAINGIGGSDARQGIKEAKRVLRPGGVLVYLHDLPESQRKRAAINLSELPSRARDKAYILPYFNYPSGNVDVFAYVRKDDVEDLACAEEITTAMVVDGVRHLLGEDWMRKVYDDAFMVGTYAKLFRRLVKELRAKFGEERVFLSDPLVPYLKESQISLMERAKLEAETLELEVDYQTAESHRIHDKEVSSLYVDEMVVPRVAYKTGSAQRAGTKISGKTPVFVGHKS